MRFVLKHRRKASEVHVDGDGERHRGRRHFILGEHDGRIPIVEFEFSFAQVWQDKIVIYMYPRAFPIEASSMRPTSVIKLNPAGFVGDVHRGEVARRRPGQLRLSPPPRDVLVGAGPRHRWRRGSGPLLRLIDPGAVEHHHVLETSPSRIFFILLDSAVLSLTTDEQPRLYLS